jgi:outer membrane protein TolC
MKAATLLAIALIAFAPARAPAQDTLRLWQLHEAALRRDPRTGQLALLESQSALRIETLASERRPQLTLSAEATHQSEVTRLSVPLGGGASPPRPPKDRWQAVVSAQQLLYDGGSIVARRRVERARLAESREGVRAALYRLRAEVDGTFFTAFILQERIAELDAVLADLDARLTVVRARVREGAALPGDTASLRAEMLRTRQNRIEAVASRDAALAVLARLTGVAIPSVMMLALPDLAAPVARALTDTTMRHARPEFAQFQKTRERLEQEASLADLDRQPRLYAFGQAGFGRPGLNQFNTGVDELWQGGVRVEWKPWNWGNSDRQRETLRLQERIVDTEQAAFSEGLDRSVQSDLAEMARLSLAIQSDDDIVALREQVERQMRAQLDEGAITASDYVTGRSDLLEARLTRQRHRAELARARAHYLTTLGIEPR